jgi:hypothetical protein
MVGLAVPFVVSDSGIAKYFYLSDRPIHGVARPLGIGIVCDIGCLIAGLALSLGVCLGQRHRLRLFGFQFVGIAMSLVSRAAASCAPSFLLSPALRCHHLKRGKYLCEKID